MSYMSFKSFIHNVHVTRFLKYVWPFFNIMNEKVKVNPHFFNGDLTFNVIFKDYCCISKCLTLKFYN